MGAATGTTLRALELFLRNVQLLSAIVILALYAYFVATLNSHSLPVANDFRAVTGISGAAVLYSLVCIIAACCFARQVRPLTSLLSMTLDVAFTVAFIYVAAVNRGGSSSCASGVVDTPFGSGDVVTGGGENGLPSLAIACRMQTACLAVAVVGLFFFLLSVLAEWLLIRHHRKESRYGPSPANDYTEGYDKKQSFWATLFRRKPAAAPAGTYNPNALPQHVSPHEVRDSYATEQTRVGSASGAPKYESLGYGGGEYDFSGTRPEDTAVTGREGFDDVPLAHYPPANYRYSDGVYERV